MDRSAVGHPGRMVCGAQTSLYPPAPHAYLAPLQRNVPFFLGVSRWGRFGLKGGQRQAVVGARLRSQRLPVVAGRRAQAVSRWLLLCDITPPGRGKTSRVGDLSDL